MLGWCSCPRGLEGSGGLGQRPRLVSRRVAVNILPVPSAVASDKWQSAYCLCQVQWHLTSGSQYIASAKSSGIWQVSLTTLPMPRAVATHHLISGSCTKTVLGLMPRLELLLEKGCLKSRNFTQAHLLKRTSCTASCWYHFDKRNAGWVQHVCIRSNAPAQFFA